MIFFCPSLRSVYSRSLLCWRVPSMPALCAGFLPARTRPSPLLPLWWRSHDQVWRISVLQGLWGQRWCFVSVCVIVFVCQIVCISLCLLFVCWYSIFLVRTTSKQHCGSQNAFTFIWGGAIIRDMLLFCIFNVDVSLPFKKQFFSSTLKNVWL